MALKVLFGSSPSCVHSRLMQAGTYAASIEGAVISSYALHLGDMKLKNGYSILPRFRIHYGSDT